MAVIPMLRLVVAPARLMAFFQKMVSNQKSDYQERDRVKKKQFSQETICESYHKMTLEKEVCPKYVKNRGAKKSENFLSFLASMGSSYLGQW